MIRVLLIDDHQLFAEGLANLLRQQTDTISMVAICTEASQVLSVIDECRPDLILLDINLGATDGIMVCRTILYHHPLLKIIAVTMHHELRFIRAMKEAGANGYLLKNTDYKQVLEAVLLVYEGGSYFDSQLEKRIRQQTASVLTKPLLNPKEKRVLDGIFNGKTSRQISQDLAISQKTVEYYRNSLFVKFNAKNVVELINKARPTT